MRAHVRRVSIHLLPLSSLDNRRTLILTLMSPRAQVSPTTYVYRYGTYRSFKLWAGRRGA
jgi:hypothetical protein